MNLLKVLSGGATQGLVEALRPAFEARTGCPIDATFGAVGAMKARLLSGEPADLMILSRRLIDELLAEGHLLADSARNIGVVETAIAVRRGDRSPAVGSRAELQAALVAADEVHFPDPQTSTAGIHFARVMKELGIGADDRLRPAPNGATAMRALAASTARRPIGCTQTTEILSTPGIVLVAGLPAGLDLATLYSAAVVARSPRQAEARLLIEQLTEQSAIDRRRGLGFL